MKTIKILNFIQIAIFLAFFVGWILSIVKLVKCDFDGSKSSYKAEAIYGLGVGTFVIGGVVGYMDLGE